MVSVTCVLGPCTGCPQNVRADSVRVVQLLCSFRPKITSPSVYDPFIGPVKNNDVAEI